MAWLAHRCAALFSKYNQLNISLAHEASSAQLQRLGACWQRRHQAASRSWLAAIFVRRKAASTAAHKTIASAGVRKRGKIWRKAQ